MLNRLFSRNSPLRILTLISHKTRSLNPNPKALLNPIPNPSYYSHPSIPRHFSSDHCNNNNNNGNDASDMWRLTPQTTDNSIDSVFGDDDDGLKGLGEGLKPLDDVFEGINVGGGEEREGGSGWGMEGEEKAWQLGGEKVEDDVFDIGEEEKRVEIAKRVEDEKKLEEEAKVLSDVLKGPNRAFGDLISASGITEEMLDSLMALKDLGGVQGLPPLSEIEDMRYEKNTRKSSRADIERQKQEEVAKARVRQVDDKGRAYGTGRRKCSIARVWIQETQPGKGKFMVNEKEFDVYFPMLDHRAALLRPFSETKTLGLWDVTCTVKGGGTTGQVGAVQLGISRALQNWEPKHRPPLRAVGFLTRDARVVERKKPGKAKARKSFQWVKR